MQKIKAVSQAFAKEPQRWQVNDRSKVGIQKIVMQLETHHNPPHPDVTKHMYIAYDEKERVLYKWQPDSINLEYF